MLELWPGELDDVDEEPGFREATSRSETLAARLLIGLANARDELLREADRLLDLAAATLNVEADDAERRWGGYGSSAPPPRSCGHVDLRVDGDDADAELQAAEPRRVRAERLGLRLVEANPAKGGGEDG